MNWLIVIFSCGATDAFHFLSGLSVGVIKHLLQGHLTSLSWIDSKPATFSNIYITLFNKGMCGAVSGEVVFCMNDPDWQFLLFPQLTRGVQQ